MNKFRLVVLGLWFGLGFVVLMIIGNSFFPGQLEDTAFTDLGILSVFAVLILDTLFSLGASVDAEKKKNNAGGGI